MKYEKIRVAHIITVPKGNFCFKFNGDNICEHFNNEGGYGECDIFHVNIKSQLDSVSSEGDLKFQECLDLKEV